MKKIIKIAAVTAFLVGGFAAIWFLFFEGRDDSRKLQVMNDVFLLELHVNQFFENTGRYPNNEEGIGILVGSAPGWNPTLSNIPVDAWGRKYQYHIPALYGTKSFSIHSFGPTPDDSNGWIGNWENGAGN